MAEEENFEEIVEEDDEKLPFAKAEVVRLMKENLDDDKMIRERVKVEMNIFLGEVLKNVCKQLNEYPYTTIEYEMLKESMNLLTLTLISKGLIKKKKEFYYI